ncbi:MAG: TrbG/VirB9 family P-type conjugative transfer protein [Telmatospirillum sp.]|nr:TrbG/VirB9 family P-type conjugative transfer protein [Telmatospirillum sp.]
MTPRAITALVLLAALPLSGMALAADPTVPTVAIPSGRPPAPLPASLPPGVPGGAGSRGATPQQLLTSTEASIDQQAKGQFPTMERGPSLPLGTLQRSWDRPVPASGQAAPGIIHYMWHPDFVMGVRTRDFMVTTVLLPPWERANEFYVGDPVVFEVKRVRPNVVAVRSRNAGADSNLTILGASGNAYNFYLRSETWNSTQVTDLTVYVDAPHPASEGEAFDVRADTVAGAALPGVAAGAMPDYLRRIVFRPEDLRFDMKMFIGKDEDADIAPERVFEDGVFTYFDYGDRGDSVARPVVHQVVDGVDTVVNSRTAGKKGNVLIAEAVGDFTLRNGNRVVCVRRIPSASPEARHPEGAPATEDSVRSLRPRTTRTQGELE